jgi:hypothetical protein
MFSPRLRQARSAFWRHPDLATLFPSLVFRMHCEARSTVSLLQTAIDRLTATASTDPVAPVLLDYFRPLLAEEVGHDDWLLVALESLGISRAEAWATLPPPTTAALVGSQYYWILHHHPVALLGFIKAVERDPPTLDEVNDLRRRTGLPKAAFAYQLGHVNIEAKHNDDLDRVLDSLSLDEGHRAIIGVSLVHTVELLARSLEELVRLHDLSEPTARAMS